MTAKPKTIKLARILRHLDLSQNPLGRLECAKGGCRYCDDQVHESFQIEMEVMAAMPDYEPCNYFDELV